MKHRLAGNNRTSEATTPLQASDIIVQDLINIDLFPDKTDLSGETTHLGAVNAH